MKLYYDPFSPCARKVRISLMELDLQGGVEEIEVDFNKTEGERWDHCPIGIIPTLVSESGDAFYDSKLCCEYLEHISANASLWPSDIKQKWAAKRLHMLADNMLDYSMSINTERTRPEIMRLQLFLDRRMNQIRGGLRGMETLIADVSNGERPNLGEIAAACCLAHFDYWRDTLDWRADHPTLKSWFDTFSQRSSFLATALPKEGPYKGLYDPNYDSQSEATQMNISFAQNYALGIARQILSATDG